MMVTSIFIFLNFVSDTEEEEKKKIPIFPWMECWVNMDKIPF